MAIKVIANYPYEDEELMQQLRESQAKAVLHVLENMLGPKGLDRLMEKIENKRQ